MTKEDLSINVEHVRRRGPTRVLISPDEGVAPSRAPSVPIDVVFIRNDGWSLGAPGYLAQAARELYRDTWIAELRTATYAANLSPLHTPTWEVFPL